MVLKELIFNNFHFGMVWSPEITDFKQFQLWMGMVALKELILRVVLWEGVVVLK